MQPIKKFIGIFFVEFVILSILYSYIFCCIFHHSKVAKIVTAFKPCNQTVQPIKKCVGIFFVYFVILNILFSQTNFFGILRILICPEMLKKWVGQILNEYNTFLIIIR